MSYLVRSVLFMYAVMGLAALPCMLVLRFFPELAPALLVVSASGLGILVCMELRRRPK